MVGRVHDQVAAQNRIVGPAVAMQRDRGRDPGSNNAISAATISGSARKGTRSWSGSPVSKSWAEDALPTDQEIVPGRRGDR